MRIVFYSIVFISFFLLSSCRVSMNGTSSGTESSSSDSSSGGSGSGSGGGGSGSGGSSAYDLSVLAGKAGGFGGIDGTGTGARFTHSFMSGHFASFVSDGTYIYSADNNAIRRTVIATGEVSTLAGKTNADRLILNSGVSADGTGSSAYIFTPSGLALVGGNLYFTEHDMHTIRKLVLSTGVVTTVAGSSGMSGDIDDTGTAARFSLPAGLATDGTNLYIADSGNETIRQMVISTGVVTTLAGSAGNSGSSDSSDGTGATARFNEPSGIVTDGTNLFVTDTYNHTIRQVVIATGETITLAGLAGNDGLTDGFGAAARFDVPFGLTLDGTDLYVLDRNNIKIRKVVISTGEVSTIDPGPVFGLRGGIVINGGDAYFSELTSIQKIDVITEAIETFAGEVLNVGTSDGTGTAARFGFFYMGQITGVGSDLYVTDGTSHTIRKVVADTGVVTTIAGNAGNSGTTDDTGTAAEFNSLQGITNDGTNLYVADTDNHTIRKIVISSGVVTTIAGNAGNSGTTDDTGTAAEFDSPTGITTDGTNLYVVDSDNHTIRQIVIATGVVTTLAGTAGNSGDSDGTGAAAEFDFDDSQQITTDGTNLYVCDGNRIRQIVIATGVVTTLAGTYNTAGSSDGIGAAALFLQPLGITTDGTYVYVVDAGGAIRQIEISTGNVSTFFNSYENLGVLEGDLSVASSGPIVGILLHNAEFYVSTYFESVILKITDQ